MLKMDNQTGPLCAVRKTGAERFRDGQRVLDADLLGFWQWSASDLVSNTMRGVLAEYIVARALGIADGLRSEWRAFDLQTADGAKVEVKSAAYVQSWKQDDLSVIQFGVSKRRAWDAETGILSGDARRHADVYAFALLHHKDRYTIDPMDLAQWEFYVVPTKLLDERGRSQHSITLPSLKTLAGSAVNCSELKAAVLSAAARQRASVVSDAAVESSGAPDDAVRAP